MSRLEKSARDEHACDYSRDRLAELEEENNILKAEVRFQRRRSELMREALITARATIETLVAKKKSKVVHQARSQALFSWPRDHINRGLKHAVKKAHSHQAYISRSALEALVLSTIRRKVPSVQRVFIDFDLHSAPGPNWKISGVTSGKADPEVAMAAAREAAHQHKTLVMIEDGCPLNGRSPAKLRLVVR